MVIFIILAVMSATPAVGDDERLAYEMPLFLVFNWPSEWGDRAVPINLYLEKATVTRAQLGTALRKTAFKLLLHVI